MAYQTEESTNGTRTFDEEQNFVKGIFLVENDKGEAFAVMIENNPLLTAALSLVTNENNPLMAIEPLELKVTLRKYKKD